MIIPKLKDDASLGVLSEDLKIKFEDKKNGKLMHY
jgi:hypothetical protein